MGLLGWLVVNKRENGHDIKVKASKEFLLPYLPGVTHMGGVIHSRTTAIP